MKNYQLPPYGHGVCPNCKSQFFLQTGTVGFGVRANGSDYLLYILCGPCNLKMEDCTPDQKRLMASECTKTVLASEDLKEESLFWSLTGTSKNGTFLRGRRLIYAVRTQGLCFASDR